MTLAHNLFPEEPYALLGGEGTLSCLYIKYKYDKQYSNVISRIKTDIAIMLICWYVDIEKIFLSKCDRLCNDYE